MEGLCQFHKYGFCKLKDECPNLHVKEECTNGLFCKTIQSCALRHPKMCRRMVLEGLCQFKDKCAYKHKKTMNSQSVDNDVHEDVKKLKDEVITLKSTIISIVKTREKGDILENTVKGLREEIEIIKASNKQIVEHIKQMEKDHTDESEVESSIISGTECTCDTSKSRSAVKLKSGNMTFKCDICEYTSKTYISMNKHKNTKHGKLKCEDCSKICKSDDDMEKHIKSCHIETSEKYDLSGIDSSMCPICGKNCQTKTKVCEHFEKDHMENKEGYKNQSLSDILTLEAKKSLTENCDEDIEWTNENVDELLDRFEAQMREAECTNSDSE